MVSYDITKFEKSAGVKFTAEYTVNKLGCAVAITGTQIALANLGANLTETGIPTVKTAKEALETAEESMNSFEACVKDFLSDIEHPLGWVTDRVFETFYEDIETTRFFIDELKKTNDATVIAAANEFGTRAQKAYEDLNTYIKAIEQKS